MKPEFGQRDGPFETLAHRAYLRSHDEVAVPDVVSEWAEGSFRAGFLLGLALCGDPRIGPEHETVRAAVEEAVAIVAAEAAGW